jgi:pimeloyl-ACP methyl ester carboxylesterase
VKIFNILLLFYLVCYSIKKEELFEKYTLNLNNHDIQIHDTETASKQTIVGIHGLTGNAYQLGYFIDEFGDDYRFITMDVYGRANSKANETESSLFEQAKDIQALIDNLALEKVILMGYSMGAYISAIVASQTPAVEAVILLDGAATMSEHQRPIIEPGLERLSKKYPSKDQYVSEVANGYQNFGIETTERLKAYLAYEIEKTDTQWENKASEAVVRNDWESFWQFDAKSVGREIKQPTLLVQASGTIGEHPPLFLPEHYEKTIAAIDNIEVVVSKANHYTIGFEKRPDINRLIQDFLEKI